MGEVSVDHGYRSFFFFFFWIGIGLAQKYINDITILVNNTVFIR